MISMIMFEKINTTPIAKPFNTVDFEINLARFQFIILQLAMSYYFDYYELFFQTPKSMKCLNVFFPSE